MVLSGTTLALLALRYSPVHGLTEEKYKQMEAHLLAVTREGGPNAALSELETLLEGSEEVLQSCHRLVHAIGHEAYETYGITRALEHSDEACGAGYTHGVIEAYIEEVGYTKTRLAELCEQYPVGKNRDNCFHGVGHGLMYYHGNNLPEALATCNELGTHRDRLRCTEGTFMENFESDEVFHPSDFVNKEDIFDACRTQKLAYQKGACYFYAPLYFLNSHPRQYETMFKLCGSAEPDFLPTCIKGAASRVTKDTIRRIHYVEWLCSKQTGQEKACASGIGSYHFTQFGDEAKTRSMCDSLRPDYQSACLSALPTASGL